MKKKTRTEQESLALSLFGDNLPVVKVELDEAAIEAGRKFWQEYASLADDLPDDLRKNFGRCSYLAGRFADALRSLEDEQN
jgi:hypothetical protein